MLIFKEKYISLFLIMLILYIFISHYSLFLIIIYFPAILYNFFRFFFFYFEALIFLYSVFNFTDLSRISKENGQFFKTPSGPS